MENEIMNNTEVMEATAETGEETREVSTGVVAAVVGLAAVGAAALIKGGIKIGKETFAKVKSGEVKNPFKKKVPDETETVVKEKKVRKPKKEKEAPAEEAE